MSLIFFQLIKNYIEITVSLIFFQLIKKLYLLRINTALIKQWLILDYQTLKLQQFYYKKSDKTKQKLSIKYFQWLELFSKLIK